MFEQMRSVFNGNEEDLFDLKLIKWSKPIKL